jgi:tetratricopeptide (TPR) repeat protein
MEIGEKALEWCKEDEHNHDYLTGDLYYLLEDWDNAQQTFEKLYKEYPEDFYCIGYLGLIAARKGEMARKSTFISLLEEADPQFRNGKTYMWRARIAAVSGDKAEAVKLIRKAILDGYFLQRIHDIIDFETLYAYAPFQELIKPKEFSD